MELKQTTPLLSASKRRVNVEVRFKVSYYQAQASTSACRRGASNQKPCSATSVSNHSVPPLGFVLAPVHSNFPLNSHAFRRQDRMFCGYKVERYNNKAKAESEVSLLLPRSFCFTPFFSFSTPLDEPSFSSFLCSPALAFIGARAGSTRATSALGRKGTGTLSLGQCQR